ncbi:MAG: DUF2721 domain-containing protein [Pseudomonadota bacterium]
MDFTVNVSTVSELIQLSLVPVFLLLGIGQILNVVTGRLARIVDRSRWYDKQKNSGEIQEFDDFHCSELDALRRRMRCANTSISFLTAAALLVCVTVALLLANGITAIQLDYLVLGLFILAMLSITAGLIYFFIEVSIASATLRIPKTNTEKC